MVVLGCVMSVRRADPDSPERRSAPDPLLETDGPEQTFATDQFCCDCSHEAEHRQTTVQ